MIKIIMLFVNIVSPEQVLTIDRYFDLDYIVSEQNWLAQSLKDFTMSVFSCSSWSYRCPLG